MRAPLVALLLLPLFTVVSCDQVKKLSASVSTAVKGAFARKSRAGGSAEVDADLQKLVDQTAAGAIFRKDLPFPTRLEVNTTSRNELSGRFYQSSAIDKVSAVVKGTQLVVSKFELADNQVRYTEVKSSFTAPGDPAGTKNKAPEPIEVVKPPESPVTFRKFGDKWQAASRSNIRAAALAKELGGVFDQLLVEHALAPRPLWFAKHRFKVGDQLVVAGDSLAMLTWPGAKGSCTLKLESFGAVDGHPCGIFSVTGDYSLTRVPDFAGNFSDGKIAIQSGRIWFSLIYPVILKEELQTIQSLRSGGTGGLVTRGQGTIEVAVTRTWKRLDP